MTGHVEAVRGAAIRFVGGALLLLAGIALAAPGDPVANGATSNPAPNAAVPNAATPNDSGPSVSGPILSGPTPPGPTLPGPDYAESVMLGAMSLDGATEISLRLARHPARNSGTVWLHVAVDGEAWSLVEEDLRLHGEPVVGAFATGLPTTDASATDAPVTASSAPEMQEIALATPVADDAVEFRAGGRGDAWFQSRMRHTSTMHGEVRATLYAHPTRDPVPGPGDVPIRLELGFTANDPGGRLNNDTRWELFGRVHGRLYVGGRVHEIDLPGKWHEQVGDRPSFAPAFTYFNVQGPRFGLLAIDYTGRAVGFADLEGTIVPVRRFVIDPVGKPERHFEVELDDGSQVTGSARVVQLWSVPIEGQRRPGAGVVVESNRGALVGSLNDWQPEAPTPKRDP